jgi:hypothetical protein
MSYRSANKNFICKIWSFHYEECHFQGSDTVLAPVKNRRFGRTDRLHYQDGLSELGTTLAAINWSMCF